MDEDELLEDEDYVDLVVDMIESQDIDDDCDRTDLDDELELLKELGF